MSIKQNMLKGEQNLSNYACYDVNAIRIKKIDEDIRPNYFRDTDKIIFSHSYARYMDKTQVFSFKHNDHISKRMIHVQLVSKIGRTIGRALNLNEDLIEAIALGHDLGHVPFGHVGEKELDSISKNHLNQPFLHNVQSVRNLMNLENSGNGLNLTIQTLDGILCHNGEKILQKYEYQSKTKEQFLEEYNSCYRADVSSRNLKPMTLEGAIIQICDVVSYLGRDIEDAVLLNIINIDSIPKSITKIIGNKNSTIIDFIVNDIIANSYGKNHIELSDNCYNLMNELMKFNYQNIYDKAYTNQEKENMREMFDKLFRLYLNQLQNNEIDAAIYTGYLNEMSIEYKQNTKNERIVIDYMAGMTDDYFLSEFNKINS